MNNCNDDPARNRVKITLCKQKTIHLVKKIWFQVLNHPKDQLIRYFQSLDKDHNLTAVIASQAQSSPQVPLVLLALAVRPTITLVIFIPHITVKALERLVERAATLTVPRHEGEEVLRDFTLQGIFSPSGWLGVTVDRDLAAITVGGTRVGATTLVNLFLAARWAITIRGIAALALGLARFSMAVRRMTRAMRLLLANFQMFLGTGGTAPASADKSAGGRLMSVATAGCHGATKHR